MDPQVAGVDGCRGGWVVARTGADGAAPVHVEVVPSLDDVVRAVSDGRLVAVGIDMPLGLPDDGVRAADRAARALLGPRRSSLFPTPSRAVLDATDHADANERSRAASGKGLSIQAFHLLPKMRELDALVTPALQPAIAEVHPETSFAVLRGSPCTHPKRTPEGRAERLAALTPWFEAVSFAAAVAWRGRAAAPDDVLDALAAAWTARRLARGEALVLGDPDARDTRGMRCTIVA